jgi:DNA-binding LacI/PurR family transcriptional regulator
MPRTFEIKHPLPSRRSAEALRDQIVEFFMSSKPLVGERFLSDYELARAAGLSKPTIRKALEDLCREGWIERRNGLGTFVGPRAGMPITRRRETADSSKRLVRLAVLVHTLGDARGDWYSPGVLGGLDDVAHESGVCIELLGHRDGDFKSVSQRLAQTRPDLLALTAPQIRYAPLIGESRRLGIPCIGTGTYLTELSVPTVYEDGALGAADAVKHLIEQGHKKIGFVQFDLALPWVFQRRRGYAQAMREAGLASDDRYVLWLSSEDDVNQQAATLHAFLRTSGVTAIVAGSFWPLMSIAPLVKSGAVRVPQDVSVVTFDQHPDAAAWLGGVEPTTVRLPLRRMGQQLARMARACVDGETVAPSTVLPCELKLGASVSAPRDESVFV